MKNKYIFVLILSNFYQVMTVPVAVIAPRSSLPTGSALSSLQIPVVSMQTHVLLDATAHNDIPSVVNVSRLVDVCNADLALQREYEKYRSLKALFACYIENAHLFGDEGLVGAIFNNDRYLETRLDDEDDEIYRSCVVETIERVDDSTAVIGRAVDRILKRYSFDNLEIVTTAIQELQNDIERTMLRYDFPACQVLLTDLRALNSQPLSASYGCMQKVSGILNQLPPDSAQAIREQLPWYLRRMV